MSSHAGALVVGQSGGGTAVINATLAGIVVRARELGIRRIAGRWDGVDGLLADSFADLSGLSDDAIYLLSSTPSGALGLCRSRLRDGASRPACYARFRRCPSSPDASFRQGARLRRTVGNLPPRLDSIGGRARRRTGLCRRKISRAGIDARRLHHRGRCRHGRKPGDHAVAVRGCSGVRNQHRAQRRNYGDEGGHQPIQLL